MCMEGNERECALEGEEERVSVHGKEWKRKRGGNFLIYITFFSSVCRCAIKWSSQLTRY